MNEQDQIALKNLSAGDNIVIFPYADRKYSVDFRSVDMDKQTLTVYGDFSVTHRIESVNDMASKYQEEIGTRTYSFSDINSWHPEEKISTNVNVDYDYVAPPMPKDLTPEQRQAVLDKAIEQLDNPPPSGSTKTFVLNPDDPSSFYQSNDSGQWELLSCPRGMLYNPILNVCDYPDCVTPDINPALGIE